MYTHARKRAQIHKHTSRDRLPCHVLGAQIMLLGGGAGQAQKLFRSQSPKSRWLRNEMMHEGVVSLSLRVFIILLISSLAGRQEPRHGGEADVELGCIYRSDEADVELGCSHQSGCLLDHVRHVHLHHSPAHGGGHAMDKSCEPPEDDSCRLLSGDEEREEGEAVVSGSDPETVSSTSSQSGESHCDIMGKYIDRGPTQKKSHMWQGNIYSNQGLKLKTQIVMKSRRNQKSR